MRAADDAITPSSSHIDSTPSTAVISDRLAFVKNRVTQAARASGRDERAIAIVAVTKTHPLELVQNAVQAGMRDFGENYVQEALAKQAALGGPGNIRRHFIGHLQSNKVNAIAGRFALVQAVDSINLGERLSSASLALGQRQDILIQIKLGEEPTKSGIPPKDVEAICDRLDSLPGLRVRGLFAIAPLTDAEGAPIADGRPYFDLARNVFDRLAPEHRQVLSMGMSADFEAAIAAGSTMIRIGSALFGRRPPRF